MFTKERVNAVVQQSILPCPDCTACGLCNVSDKKIEFTGNIHDLSIVPDDKKVQVQMLFKMAGFETKLKEWSSEKDTIDFTFDKHGRSFDGTIHRNGDISLEVILPEPKKIPEIQSAVPQSLQFVDQKLPTPPSQTLKKAEEGPLPLEKTEKSIDLGSMHTNSLEISSELVGEKSITLEQDKSTQKPEFSPEVSSLNNFHDMNHNEPAKLTSVKTELPVSTYAKSYEKTSYKNGDMGNEYVPLTVLPTQDEMTYWQSQMDQDSEVGSKSNHIDLIDPPLIHKPLPVESLEVIKDLPKTAENEVVQPVFETHSMPTPIISLENQENPTVLPTIMKIAEIVSTKDGSSNSQEYVQPVSNEMHNALVTVIKTHEEARKNLFTFLASLMSENSDSEDFTLPAFNKLSNITTHEELILRETSVVPRQTLKQFLIASGAQPIDVEGEINFTTQKPEDIHKEKYLIEENGEQLVIQIRVQKNDQVEFLASKKAKKIVYSRLKKYLALKLVADNNELTPEEDGNKIKPQVQTNNATIGLIFIASILIFIPQYFDQYINSLVLDFGEKVAHEKIQRNARTM
jgi:hypothetical protein